jgi:hypothetical protein
MARGGEHESYGLGSVVFAVALEHPIGQCVGLEEKTKATWLWGRGTERSWVRDEDLLIWVQRISASGVVAPEDLSTRAQEREVDVVD